MMDDSNNGSCNNNSNNNKKLRMMLIHRILTKHAVWTGLFIRLFLAWILPMLLDGNDVAYTDIDYHVFTDAAAYVQQGQSPYQRTTYRYTPFLATMLSWLPFYETTGRYVFCIADNLCGWIIVKFRQEQRREQQQQQQQQEQQQETGENLFVSQDLQDALWWLYNPLAINICTRGSAESLQVLLPVLLTLCLLESVKTRIKNIITTPRMPTSTTTTTTTADLYGTAVVAGIIHGVAIHSKIYPIIYTLSFLTALVPHYNQTMTTKAAPRNGSTGGGGLFRFIIQWIRRLLLASPAAPLVFGFVSLFTFVGLTWLAVHWYGPLALHEGLLYHFGRVDHRHNFSMHWYWIYLARAAAAAATTTAAAADASTDGGVLFLSLAGRLLFLPQLVLLLYSSLIIAPQNLSLALFVQTFLFVAHNKVITGQYFTWYLCLLPLCSSCMRWTRRVQTAIGVLLLSLVTWWTFAYCLEMRGMAVHRQVWLASVLFFAAQVNLLSALLHSTRHSTPPPRTCLLKKKWSEANRVSYVL
jgi:GPI mannosyltransferase 1 subunit M